MSFTHKFVLPVPPSANEYWVPIPGRGMAPSKKAIAYREMIARKLTGYRPLVGDVVGEFVYYRQSKRGDLSNRIKVVEDALQGIAFLDDSQIREYRRFERLEDPDNPRVELVYEGERLATREEANAFAMERFTRNEKRKQTIRKNRALKASASRMPKTSKL